MRLSTDEIRAIKKCIAEFDPDAPVYLFGSRTRDDLRGGDIDLLVLSDNMDLETKIRLKLKLYDAIGEQKIDIITPDESNEAFVAMALEEGVLL